MPSSEYQRAWAKQNPEKIKAAQARYREKNRQEVLERDRQRRQDNLEEYRERDRVGYHKRFRENPEKIRQQARASKIKRLYGITLDEYDAMLAAQDNKCACCRSPEVGSKYKNWHVDHDHQTGKVRALLCHHCNVLVGMAKENPDTLQNVINFLQIHKDVL